MRVPILQPFNFRLNSILFFLLLFFVFPFTYGQSVGNYTVTRTTGNTYNSIATTGFAVPSWRNNGAFSQDDNRSQFLDIGFDFWYNGALYTQFCVSTNGFIDFSTSTDDGGPVADDFGYNNAAFTQSNINNATRPAIAPFYDDMTAQGGLDPLGNSIRYLTTGTAPNRILTVEWINMAVYLNTSPSLNFQVKLYETSGRIEINYGTMTQGSHNFSYTVGINAPTMNVVPTVVQLKTQQTANSAIFSNVPQNNLSAMPASGSSIMFTPPLPANPPAGNLTFSSVAQTSMTLNWPDWASNEVGYVVYYSYDAINYFFAGQTAANATSFNATGLWPGTTYQWRVYAVTEGALSSARAGTQITNAAGNKVSAGNGNWSQNNSWIPSGVPTAGDNVTIQNGHTITLNTDGVCNNLTVGQGSSGILQIGNNGQARTLTVNGNITVAVNGTFTIRTNSNTTHKIDLRGKIMNNGNFDMAPDNNSLCDISFNRNSSMAVSGTGIRTRFNRIIMNVGSSCADNLDITASNLSFPNDFLVLNSGTFHLNSSQTNNYTVSTLDYDIPLAAGIWLEGNSTLTFDRSVTLNGCLKVAGGTVVVGTGNDRDLISNGGSVTISNGNLVVAGKYYNPNQNTIPKFIMSGGTMTVADRRSSSTTEAPFNITSPGAIVTISGGTIIIQERGGNASSSLGYLINNVSFSSVTGGTLQIGQNSSPGNQTIKINSSIPIGNLVVNKASDVAQLDVNSLTVLNNITISAGTLDANNLNCTLGGNWLNTGNTFIPGSGTVTFNPTSPVTISKTNGETFNNLIIGGSSSVTSNNNLLVNGSLTINSTLDVSTANSTIDLKRNWINNGTFVERSGRVNFNGTVLQNLSGTSTNTNFYELNIQNPAGVSINNGNYTILDALFLNSGNFNVSAANSITLRSTAAKTARIAPVVSGSITGNFRVERYISNRSAGYSDLASPVTSTSFQDWGNELLLIYGAPPAIYPSAWGYSEPIWDFVPVTTPSTPITPGKGFEVYLDSDGNYTVFNAQTINSIGQPNVGAINLSSSITRVNDGWNLIGNPYASYVSWNAIHASSSQIAPSILIYDEAINDYQTFNLGSGLELAPHQGFWIQATGTTPSLIIDETHKTTSTNSNFRSAESIFTLRIEGDFKPAFSSNAQFLFSSEASLLDDEGDVSFKGLPHPYAPDLCSRVGEKFLRLNHLPSDEAKIIIPLNMSLGKSATYTISAINVELLYANGFSCAVLLDQKTGERIDLFSNETFTFEGGTSDDPSRFMLLLSKNGDCNSIIQDETLVNFVQQNDGITVQLKNNAKSNASVQLVNNIGQAILPVSSLSPGSLVKINNPNTTGIYHIIVTVDGKSYSKKFYASF